MPTASRASTPVRDKTFGMSPTPGKGQRENFTFGDGAVPESEAGLAAAVRDLFSQSREGRRSRTAQWNRNAEVLANRTWLASRPRWMPTPEVPEIYPILASIVGWVTDTRPTFDAVPFTAPNTPYHDFWLALSDDLTTVISSAFIAQTQEREVEKCTWDAYTLGTGIVKTVWDQSLDGGLGNVALCRTNPYHFYPDPHATSTEDGSFYIEVRTMSLQELDRRYPGAAKNPNALLMGSQEGIDREPSPDDPSTSLPMANPGAISGHTPSYGLPGQSRDKVDPVRSQPVTVFECWMREHVHMPNEAEDTAYPTSTEEMWRCVVVCGNRVLLDDSAENLFGHNWHPYDRFVQHETGSFWGRSMVEDLTPSQIAINRSLAAIQQNLELTGNPILKDNVRSLLHRTPITNRPGTRIQVGDGGDVDWMDPPAVAEAHKWLIEFHLAEMEKISGLSAMTRGTVPTGRNSTDVMNAVQESSFVRIRLALRNMEYCLRSAFTKYAQLVVRNYTVPRTVAVVGPTGERTTLALRSRHFMTDTEQGAIPLKFQLNINAGSQLPISPQAMAEKANFLFSAGAIDEIALLQAHRWPHYAQVYERVMQQRQAMLTAQAAPQ
jgi:hypothetical protein